MGKKVLCFLILSTFLMTTCDKKKDIIGSNEIEKERWVELADFGYDLPTKVEISRDGCMYVGGSDVYKGSVNHSSYARIFDLKASRVNDILITLSNEIIVSSENMGIWYSDDSSLGWKRISEFPYYYGMDINENGLIFVGMERTIMKLDSDFKILEYILIPLPQTGLYKCVKVNSLGYVVVTSETGSVFMSMDDGANWQKISSGLDTIFKPNWLHDDYTMAIAPDNTIYLATPRGVYETSDIGNSWSCMGLDSIYITSIACDSIGNVYAAAFGDLNTHINEGESKGIFFYDQENKAWQDISYNLRGKDSHGLTISPSGDLYIFTRDAKLYRFKDTLY